MRDMILGCINCCLFDIGSILRGGFEMSNVRYTEPKTVLSALQVVGDITLVALSSSAALRSRNWTRPCCLTF